MGCEVIEFDTAKAIICGRKDHNCNSKGPTVYFFNDGFVGTLFEKAREQGFKFAACDQDILYFLSERGIDLRGASVSCSICRKPEMPRY